jgi:hypothetical protein
LVPLGLFEVCLQGLVLDPPLRDGLAMVRLHSLNTLNGRPMQSFVLHSMVLKFHVFATRDGDGLKIKGSRCHHCWHINVSLGVGV